MPPVMLPGGQRGGVALAGTSLLCGCMSDPAVDPEVQPLEIVAGNPDPKYGPCILNVEQVAAGVHDVVAIPMGGPATVRIVDPSGRAIFRRAVQGGAAEGEGSEVLAGDDQSVRLAERQHRVECVLPTGTHTLDLLVVPARPGYTPGGKG